MRRRRGSASQRVLITIPISHYCEKARWALERSGLDFVERRHLQVIHRFVTLGAGGGKTAPVLLMPDGVLADSTDILAYANRAGRPAGWLYPDAVADEVRALEHDFDRRLGPAGRLWMYHETYDAYQLVRGFGVPGVPSWQRRALPILWPVAKRIVRRVLRVSDGNAAAALRTVEASFDAVAERLADGRRYLAGDSFTAADLTFAALSGAVLVPPHYGVPLPQPELLPEPMAERVRELRDHPAGRFALRIYEQER